MRVLRPVLASRDVAEQRSQLSIAQLKLPFPDGELGALARSFVHQLRGKNRAVTTMRAYVEAIVRLDEFLAAHGMPQAIGGITREHVESFIIALLEAGSPASALARYRALQQFFKFLEEEGEIERSPMTRMHPPHVPETPVPVLQADELKRLLKSCEGRGFDERRDLALIAVLVDTGLRRAELAGLQLGDVDLDLQQATVVGKGSRVRTVDFGRRATQALDRYLRVRSQHDAHTLEWLWLGRSGRLTAWGIAQVMERRAKQAGVEHANLHRFRHTAAHLWMAAEGSETGAMQHFGWRSRQMLSRYGASAAAERARAEHRRLSPLDRL